MSEGETGDDNQEAMGRLYDRSLVLRFQIGDESAFAEIVARMHPRLRQFLVSAFGLQPADVEDLLQDVWVDACGGLRRLRKPASLRPWMYRVARNRALKHLRRRRLAVGLDASQVPARASEDGEADRLARLRAALGKMSPAHREAVVLRYEHGLSYEEIARALKCRVGTVRSRLHYAKSILHDELGRLSDDEE